MKVYISILVLFYVNTVSVAAEASIDPKDLYLKVDNPQKFVDSINRVRTMDAHMYQIPNMYKMIWDSDLEAKLSSMKCGDMKDGSNYIFQALPDHDAANKEWLEASSDFKDQTLIARIGDLIDPDQNRIGCIELKVKCLIPSKPLKEACLAGPKGDRPISMKKGPPGSDCPYEKTEDGLCEHEGQQASKKKEPKTADEVSEKEVNRVTETVNTETTASSEGFACSYLSLLYIVSMIFLKFLE